MLFKILQSVLKYVTANVTKLSKYNKKSEKDKRGQGKERRESYRGYDFGFTLTLDVPSVWDPIQLPKYRQFVLSKLPSCLLKPQLILQKRTGFMPYFPASSDFPLALRWDKTLLWAIWVKPPWAMQLINSEYSEIPVLTSKLRCLKVGVYSLE